MSESAMLKVNMKQICFIDDSKTSAFVTKKMLKQHGYRVQHFSDAESALEALMENDYDLIITDLMISADGGVNGDDLIRLVRLSGHPIKSQIPIIVVTGTSDQDVLQSLISVGANKVLQKPLDAQSLHESIQSLVSEPMTEPVTESVAESIVELPAKEAARVEILDSPVNILLTDKEKSNPTNDVKFNRNLPVADKVKKDDSINQHDVEKNTPDLSGSGLDLNIQLQMKNLDTDTQPVKEKDSENDILASLIKLQTEQLELPQSDRVPDNKLDEKQNNHSIPSFSMSEYSSELSLSKDSLSEEKEAIPVLTTSVETDVQSVGDEIEKLLGKDAQVTRSEIKLEIINDSDEALFLRGSHIDERNQLKAEQEKLKHEQELLKIAQEKVRKEREALVGKKIKDSIHQETTMTEDQLQRGESQVTKTQATKPQSSKPQPPKPEPPQPPKSHAEAVKENPLLALLDHMDDESNPKNMGETETQNKPASLFQNLNSDGMGAKILLLIVFLSVILPALWFWYMGQRVIEVTTLEVEVGPIYSQISVPGRIDSKRKIKVSAREAGQLVKVFVNEGDSIKKGQILAQIDDSEAVSNIKRAEARLLSIEEEVSLTSKTQERLQRALDVGAVSRQMVEDAEARWKSASAEQSVVEEELKSAELKRNRLKIRGPFEGVITAVFVQEGQWVSQSENLFSLVDMNQRVVEIFVDASDGSSLHVGQTVILRSGAFEGSEWEESIVKIGSATNTSALANTIKVTASLSKNSPELRVGQQVDAEIRTHSKKEALLLPYDVVFNYDGLQTVAVVENGSIVFIHIETGIESFSRIEVLKGLRAGQPVVIPSGVALEPGMNAVMVASLDPQMKNVVE